MKNKQRLSTCQNLQGFTLIELLTVIAVIAIVSIVVLVNLHGTKDKARIDIGLSFSQSIHGALGAYTVGAWSFNEGSGNTVSDSSIYGNNGTISGAAWTAEGDTPSGNGYALSFDSSNDYINMGNPADGHLDFDFRIDSFTISAWIKSIGDTGISQYIIEKHTGAGNAPGFHFHLARLNRGGNLRFMIHTSSGGVDANPGNTNLIDNKWHHVAVIYDAFTDTINLYVDGKRDSDPKLYTPDNTSENNTNLKIGNYNSYGVPFNGLIDEVRIYRQAFTAMEIQKQYVEGLNKYKLVEKYQTTF